MNIKAFLAQFKRFRDLAVPVNFGDSDEPHVILGKPAEIVSHQEGKRVVLFEGTAGSPCITADQLFKNIKQLKDCDEFELVIIPADGKGFYPVDFVSARPIRGVIFLDCNKDTLR